MTLITTKVFFKGLYHWGKGWENSDVANRWVEFWNSKDANGIFWHHFSVKHGFGDIDYLVSTGGTIYLHPMSFDVLTRKYGKTAKYVKGVEIETFSEIEELEDILKKCCEYCGCSYTIRPLKFHEIEP